MEIQDFIQNFADQFEDLSMDELTVDTVFKSLDEWTSLAALSVIAMIETSMRCQSMVTTFVIWKQ